MKNSSYWEQRVANKTWNIYNSLEERNRALEEIYQEAYLDIEEELYKIAKKIETGIPTLSDMHKYNRLGKLKDNIKYTLKQLGKEIEKRTTNQITKAFIENYNNTMKELGELEYTLPNKKLIESLLKFPWSGDNFSSRLWENTRVLERNLNEILTRGLVQGKTIFEMATQLEERMMKGFDEAHRLVRTETMHYLNESSLRAYIDSGIKKVQLWAALDERTCPKCGVKHGNPYNLKDAPVLPLHANCRCTYLPVVDDEHNDRFHDKAKEEVNNEFNRRKNIGYKYTNNGIIKITEDHKGEHYSPPRKYKPYAVIETNKTDGKGFEQIDRTLYNKDGMMVKQIHSSHHNRPKQHPYGNHGEHMHVYVWDTEGNLKSREVKELTKKERKEHRDILKED